MARPLLGQSKVVPDHIARNGGTYELRQSGVHLVHAPRIVTEHHEYEHDDDDDEYEGQDRAKHEHKDQLAPFRRNFRLRVLDRPSPDELVFELVGCDVSFANALRRCMIQDVPTVAIERVYVWNNTSIVHDEVLAHRLGLVPLAVDPRLFDDLFEGPEEGGDGDEGGGGDDGAAGEAAAKDASGGATDRNTVVFKLMVECGRSAADDAKKRRGKSGSVGGGAARDRAGKGGARAGAGDTHSRPLGRGGKEKGGVLHPVESGPELERVAAESVDVCRSRPDSARTDHRGVVYPPLSDAVAAASSSTTTSSPRKSGRQPYTLSVYSGDIEFVPQGDQDRRFPDGIKPVHSDILLAKLRPGQKIEIEAHARRGTGRDHAKFSPVATASYRLMPTVELLRDVYDEKADELAYLYEPGVFRVVPCDDDDDDDNHNGGESKHKNLSQKKHTRKAVVDNPYACTMSRNYMRDPELKDSVRMGRIPDHFVFSVESVGMMTPAVIVSEAIKVLQSKCHNVIRMANEALEAEALGE